MVPDHLPHPGIKRDLLAVPEDTRGALEDDLRGPLDVGDLHLSGRMYHGHAFSIRVEGELLQGFWAGGPCLRNPRLLRGDHQRPLGGCAQDVPAPVFDEDRVVAPIPCTEQGVEIGISGCIDGIAIFLYGTLRLVPRPGDRVAPIHRRQRGHSHLVPGEGPCLVGADHRDGPESLRG